LRERESDKDIYEVMIVDDSERERERERVMVTDIVIG
jgi:hypothetical protein